ncbi:hypothetical protein VP01_255g1 [Puccinia sorghi]|uniref:Uncharacterized protein n=1 Tax=Puccinia sorghi TaxID=27349 RepID=A0A0L6V5S2_9BASI|nr:hypothetical protein VP01_255g1 [Puccinia sorghi]
MSRSRLPRTILKECPRTTALTLDRPLFTRKLHERFFRHRMLMGNNLTPKKKYLEHAYQSAWLTTEVRLHLVAPNSNKKYRYRTGYDLHSPPSFYCCILHSISTYPLTPLPHISICVVIDRVIIFPKLVSLFLIQFSDFLMYVSHTVPVLSSCTTSLFLTFLISLRLLHIKTQDNVYSYNLPKACISFSNLIFCFLSVHVTHCCPPLLLHHRSIPHLSHFSQSASCFPNLFLFSSVNITVPDIPQVVTISMKPSPYFVKGLFFWIMCFVLYLHIVSFYFILILIVVFYISCYNLKIGFITAPSTRKHLLNCLQLTCRKSQEASFVNPTILQNDCQKIYICKNMEFGWQLGWSMLHVNCRQLSNQSSGIFQNIASYCLIYFRPQAHNWWLINDIRTVNFLTGLAQLGLNRLSKSRSSCEGRKLKRLFHESSMISFNYSEKVQGLHVGMRRKIKIKYRNSNTASLDYGLILCMYPMSVSECPLKIFKPLNLLGLFPSHTSPPMFLLLDIPSTIIHTFTVWPEASCNPPLWDSTHSVSVSTYKSAYSLLRRAFQYFNTGYNFPLPCQLSFNTHHLIFKNQLINTDSKHSSLKPLGFSEIQHPIFFFLSVCVSNFSVLSSCKTHSHIPCYFLVFHLAFLTPLWFKTQRSCVHYKQQLKEVKNLRLDEIFLFFLLFGDRLPTMLELSLCLKICCTLPYYTHEFSQLLAHSQELLHRLGFQMGQVSKEELSYFYYSEKTHIVQIYQCQLASSNQLPLHWPLCFVLHHLHLLSLPLSFNVQFLIILLLASFTYAYI